MDSTESSPVKASGWTPDEKYVLLLKIIAQTTIDKPIKWVEIDMPGRTPKALMHIWAKIKSEAAEFEKGKAEAAGATEVAAPSTPAASANTRTRKSKKATGGGDAGEALDEGNDTPTKKAKATPKKRTPRAKKGEASTAKSETVVNEEVDEDVKGEDVNMEENVKEEPVNENGDDTEA